MKGTHMLNLNHLRYFYVTAQMKSVTKAAEALSISQPSLSQQLNAFEENVGFPLYYRNGRGLDLTPKGKLLYEKAAGVFVNVDDITNFIEKKRPLDQDLYSVAVCDEIERPFVAEIIGKLMHSKEQIKYDIISKPQFEITAEFYASKHDLMLTNRPLKKATPVKIFNFPVNIVTAQEGDIVHKVKENNAKAILSGLSEKLVLPSHGLSLREELDDYLYDSNLDSQVAFESNILACITRAVKLRIGCTFMPVPYVYEDIKYKKLSVLGPKKGFWQHKIYIYSKNPLAEDQICQKFITNIQSYLSFE
jgi:LysR family transcriptional activator of nhaA